MNNFDSANQPFEQYVNGKVNVKELSRTLAELELKTDFTATQLAVRTIYMRRTRNRPEDRDPITGELPPVSEMIPTKLKMIHSQLKERASFWTETLWIHSKEQAWSLFSGTGAKLFQPPSSAIEFTNVATNLVDVIDWLETTDQGELALALTSKRDVTIRHLLRLAGPKAQEQPKSHKKAIAWPWGRHNTYLLEVLEHTAQQWWKNFTPLDDTTHLRKQKVVDWIVKEHYPHVSVHVASMIYTILRADDLPKGRPRKY